MPSAVPTANPASVDDSVTQAWKIRLFFESGATLTTVS